jgi:hypothetical protein
MIHLMDHSVKYLYPFFLIEWMVTFFDRKMVIWDRDPGDLSVHSADPPGSQHQHLPPLCSQVRVFGQAHITLCVLYSFVRIYCTQLTCLRAVSVNLRSTNRLHVHSKVCLYSLMFQ